MDCDLLEKIKALPDMRKLDPDVLLERMTTEWPRHPMPQSGKPVGSIVRGLDALVIVVRYLAVMLPPGTDTGSNPIWELAWRDVQSPEYQADNQSFTLKQEIMNAVSKNDTSFFALCESQIMRETLWSLKELLLCGDPEYLDNGSTDWEKIDSPYAAFLAEMSLVSWDGKSELRMAVNQVFCDRYRSDGDAYRLTVPKRGPMILRVHLKPSAGSNLKEKDLLRFQFSKNANYKLLVAVELRTDEAQLGDTVQLYALEGPDILPTTFNASRSLRLEALGAEGCEYMLFYSGYDPTIHIKGCFACEKDICDDVDEKLPKERFRFKTSRATRSSSDDDFSTTRPRTRIKAILDALQGNAATDDTGSEAEEGRPGDKAAPTGPSGFGDHGSGGH
ncbi:hypothetical protein CKAH01_06036 [Colletotrichum kahawae]|uniref:Uncharacterized protein n=1 Tax=Colletotrichum kahawae TaxID=34407 RepID=A0AAD9YCA6_COLKA|nr:hypothetical protein CKAH01_06036 [Colletotrichum kahawae]